MKIIHGMRKSREYQSWHMMLQRCTNPNATDYKNYGGRGITVCKKWKKFILFFNDMGQRPPNTTLDRKNNSKGYYKKNCRWATKIEQEGNRRNNTLFTKNKKTQNLAAWVRELGILPATVHRRRTHLGWSYEDAVFVPVRKFQYKKK